MIGISRFARVRTALLLPVIFSGCANFESSEVKLRSVKTVGIISAVGDEFSFTTAGLSWAGRGDQRYSIGSWGLDDIITRQATSTLSGRFQVQPLFYSRAAFAATETESPVTVVRLINEDRVTALLRKNPPGPSIDAYIVVVKAKSPVGSGNRTVSGIGAVKYNSASGSYNQLYALYEVRVIDGHSFKLIEKRLAAPLEQAEPAKLPGPTRTVDDTYMPSAGDPASNVKLRDAVLDMIERSLPQTLRNLNLTEN